MTQATDGEMTAREKRTFDGATIFTGVCPWCSMSPKVEKWHGGGSRKTRIGCSNEDCPAMPSVVAPDRNKAMRKWNAQSELAAVTAQRDRLMEALQILRDNIGVASLSRNKRGIAVLAQVDAALTPKEPAS